MALTYSFPEHWDMGDQLTKDEWVFFHQELPWVLLHTGIGVVTKKSIPQIVARLTFVSEGWVKEVQERSGMPLSEYLTKFIGVKANVYIEGKGEWLKRQSQHVPPLGKKTAELLRKESDKVRAGTVSERFS